MPNHCHNRVSFYSDDTTAILKLYNIFENGTNPKTEETVFGAFVPEPDWKTTPNEAGELPIQPDKDSICLLYTSPSPRDGLLSRMPSSA